MVPILLKFSELAAVKLLKDKEKALLLDEDVSIKRRLEKAKSKGAFPIVIENIEAEETESQSKIRKLQQDIDETEKTRQKMAEALRGFLRQKPVPPTPTPISEGAPDNEKIARLEAENQEMKAELQELLKTPSIVSP
jgi:seryl-tRNA synthetase